MKAQLTEREKEDIKEEFGLDEEEMKALLIHLENIEQSIECSVMGEIESWVENLQCRVIRLDDEKKISELPDGEYVSNAISSCYFKKVGDKFVFGAGVEKTAGEMMKAPWKSIVGPLI